MAVLTDNNFLWNLINTKKKGLLASCDVINFSGCDNIIWVEKSQLNWTAVKIKNILENIQLFYRYRQKLVRPILFSHFRVKLEPKIKYSIAKKKVYLILLVLMLLMQRLYYLSYTSIHEKFYLLKNWLLYFQTTDHLKITIHEYRPSETLSSQYSVTAIIIYKCKSWTFFNNFPSPPPNNSVLLIFLARYYWCRKFK